jgi:5-oxoprolinase (ATP-hydrolysing)/N-methylhydantoinase A
MSPSSPPNQYRIGFDIGGTFTDFILQNVDAGTVRLHKRLTSAHDPAESSLIGLGEIVTEAGLNLADIGEIVHGTTLVTNAIIERRGAKLGLITTQGFRDILEMGTEQRYDIYDLFLTFPEPLVPRQRRLEVAERMDRRGAVVTELNEADVRNALDRLVAAGVEAVAVCFLHAYTNDAHERRVAAIARERHPQLALSLSCDVVAELGEYQRCVTTCANAYVQPLMARYVARLDRELRKRGFGGDLRLMHSGGGLVSPETAAKVPIRLLESGPAGGGLATALFGRLAGKPDVISFDMGGTTAKACLVEQGRTEIAPMMEAARVHRFTRGSGLPIKAPVIDMIEIGAGGGSIARIDEVGLLRVGPHSSGSAPGPACYGNGGTQPTVTDANLVLGFYDPAFFLGGRMKLDVAAARTALEAIAKPLGLSIEAAAQGIHAVVTESMAAAARVHLVEKGKDPRAYAMVGFGGAGPAHAAGVARALGVREVIIPPASGAASALGFLTAPLSFETARSRIITFETGFDAAGLNMLLANLEAEGRIKLNAAETDVADVRVERFADMRLVGQMHDIAVPLPDGLLSDAVIADIRRAFHAVYAKRYAEVPTSARFEALNFRVRCSAPDPQIEIRGAVGGGVSSAKVKGLRRAWFDGRFQEVKVWDRYALVPGDRINGPAIIEEREATTIIGLGDHIDIDAGLNLRIAVHVPEAPAARITAATPMAEAVRLIESDPVSLEIMWSRLVNVTEEMWLTVCRTAYSLVISEAQDFACELLDATGETLAHSPRAMPVFNLTLPRAVKALLAAYPPETLKPGDVLVTNDPWLCAGHLFDIAVVTPVFRGDVLVGLTGTVGHVSDIGGTKDSLRAREIYEEGFQIPPMKLYEAGKPNETLHRLLGENVRNSHQVLGDLQSFVVANTLGAQRLLALMSDYGLQDLRALAEVVQGRSEMAMREAIRALPDGVYTSTITNNPLGTPMTFPVAVMVKGDAIVVDFAGAPPAVPQGGLNSTLNYTAAHATYPLKCMLTPGVRGNSGCYRPFTVEAPEGSILNCLKPAAVNLRTRTGWYIAPNIFRALASAAPRQVQAFTGLPIASNVYGQLPDGTIYSDLLFMGGGQGASAHRDGKSGILYPTSAANTSIEMFESRVPVLVLEKSYIADSGGPGEHRGGLGQRVRVRRLEADGQTTLVSVYPEGVGLNPAGLFEGQSGGSSRGLVTDPSGRVIRDCGTGELVSVADETKIIEVVLAGGAGFGDPKRRDRSLVETDLAEGYVTADAAASIYDYRAAAQSAAE